MRTTGRRSCFRHWKNFTFAGICRGVYCNSLACYKQTPLRPSVQNSASRPPLPSFVCVSLVLAAWQWERHWSWADRQIERKKTLISYWSLPWGLFVNRLRPLPPPLRHLPHLLRRLLPSRRWHRLRRRHNRGRSRLPCCRTLRCLHPRRLLLRRRRHQSQELRLRPHRFLLRRLAIGALDRVVAFALRICDPFRLGSDVHRLALVCVCAWPVNSSHCP